MGVSRLSREPEVRRANDLPFRTPRGEPDSMRPPWLEKRRHREGSVPCQSGMPDNSATPIANRALDSRRCSDSRRAGSPAPPGSGPASHEGDVDPSVARPDALAPARPTSVTEQPDGVRRYTKWQLFSLKAHCAATNWSRKLAGSSLPTRPGARSSHATRLGGSSPRGRPLGVMSHHQPRRGALAKSRRRLVASPQLGPSSRSAR